MLNTLLSDLFNLEPDVQIIMAIPSKRKSPHKDYSAFFKVFCFIEIEIAKILLILFPCYRKVCSIGLFVKKFLRYSYKV